MAVFECTRYPQLLVYGVDGRFVAGRFETDDPREIRLVEAVPEVTRLADADTDGGGGADEVARPDGGRIARHQGRGWYRFDDEGDDGRAYRRDELEGAPGVVILDDEGDRA